MTKLDKLNKLARAANALRAAKQALAQIMDDKSDNHYLCEDARFYLAEINTLLDENCRQAGLNALIRKVKQEIDP